MPLRNGALTGQEKAFVKHYADTGNGAYAGYKAGYVDPDRTACRVIARPEVQAAVRAEQVKRMEKDLMPKAVRVLEKVLDDALSEKPTMGVKAHLEATKITLSYTAGRNADAPDKAPEDMTPAELTARIAELRARQLQAFEDMPEAEVLDNEPTQEGGIFG